ncbi:hypothetical protein HELRODRAFT_175982 [Helobdella robusta]|uniref:Uncharacterized protein n=1 Tax=Helobdella robusta TaxID=6412 RepID=T1FA00_HELRO|nr:hypothetical protein HELRODRAFT_175982 [Helobdella robusta]ESO00162.1 hypothetical protein HELRODRAFT_175982 [Helobdella robusta]
MYIQREKEKKKEYDIKRIEKRRNVEMNLIAEIIQPSSANIVKAFPKLESDLNVQKLGFMKLIVDNFKIKEPFISERIAGTTKLLDQFEKEMKIFEDFKDFLINIESSPVGSAHVEVKPAVESIQNYLNFLENEKLKLTEDFTFDEASFNGNKQTYFYLSDGMQLIANEAPTIKSLG